MQQPWLESTRETQSPCITCCVSLVRELRRQFSDLHLPETVQRRGGNYTSVMAERHDVQHVHAAGTSLVFSFGSSVDQVPDRLVEFEASIMRYEARCVQGWLQRKIERWQGEKSKNTKGDECYICGKRGHVQKDCWYKDTRGEKEKARSKERESRKAKARTRTSQSLK